MNEPTIETEIPCYEVADSAAEGEVMRFRSKVPGKGFAYLTIATKDAEMQGKVKAGKTYKITITEAE